MGRQLNRDCNMPAYFSFEQADNAGKVYEFVFQLKDQKKIAEARAIIANPVAPDRHVMGIIIPSKEPFNSKWSFHLDPDSVSFFSSAIEVCDANVTYVEKHLDEIGGSFLPHSRWCPWSSTLKMEIKSDAKPMKRKEKPKR